MMNEYSKVNFPELKFWKKTFKNNKYDYSVMINNLINLCDKTNKTEEEYLYTQSCLLLDRFIRCNQIENIFINSIDLAKFLEETNIKFSEEEIIKLLIKNKFIYYGKDKLNKGDEEYSFLGRIYIKNKERTLHVYISFLKTNAGDCLSKTLLLFSDGFKMVSFIITDDELKSINNGQNKKQTTPEVKLILNMFFYMAAFPESVLNRPPDEVCDKLNIHNSKTISMSKQIADYLHETRDVSPHLRRGHFRFLQSEHYTKKRGQTIFVKSSFVKGQAKTVIESERAMAGQSTVGL